MQVTDESTVLLLFLLKFIKNTFKRLTFKQFKHADFAQN